MKRSIDLHIRERETDRQTQTERQRNTEIWIRMIYSFRPLLRVKGCRWMTDHLAVHTIIMPMNKNILQYIPSSGRRRGEEGGGGGSEGTFLPKIEALHPENEGCLDV